MCYLDCVNALVLPWPLRPIDTSSWKPANVLFIVTVVGVCTQVVQCNVPVMLNIPNSSGLDFTLRVYRKSELVMEKNRTNFVLTYDITITSVLFRESNARFKSSYI